MESPFFNKCQTGISCPPPSIVKQFFRFWSLIRSDKNTKALEMVQSWNCLILGFRHRSSYQFIVLSPCFSHPSDFLLWLHNMPCYDFRPLKCTQAGFIFYLKDTVPFGPFVLLLLEICSSATFALQIHGDKVIVQNTYILFWIFLLLLNFRFFL